MCPLPQVKTTENGTSEKTKDFIRSTWRCLLIVDLILLKVTFTFKEGSLHTRFQAHLLHAAYFLCLFGISHPLLVCLPNSPSVSSIRFPYSLTSLPIPSNTALTIHPKLFLNLRSLRRTSVLWTLVPAAPSQCLVPQIRVSLTTQPEPCWRPMLEPRIQFSMQDAAILCFK